jgi:type II secretory pathway component PulF
MKNRISFIVVGHVTSLFLVSLFVLCVVFDFLLPQYAMYESWQQLLPGFEWISFKSLVLGAVESYIYGWIFTIIWIPIYKVFANYFNQERLNVKSQ